MKICSITDSNDLSKLSLDELMGELRMFENLINKQEGERKDDYNIGLKAEVPSIAPTEDQSEDDNPEDILLMIKKLEDFVKRQCKNQGENFYDKLQCHECQGYGHFKSECPTALRRKENAMIAKSSKSNFEQSDYEGNNLMALTSIPEEKRTQAATSDDDSDEEPTDEAIVEKYAELFQQWTETLKVNSSLFKESCNLKIQKQALDEKITRLEEKLTKLNEELKKEVDAHKVTKYERAKEKKLTNMMSKGSKDLGKVLAAQRLCNRGHPGLGSEGQDTAEETKFVPATVLAAVPEPPTAPVKLKNKDTRVCHFCKKLGHIKTKCAEFLKVYRRKPAAYEENEKASHFWRSHLPAPKEKPRARPGDRPQVAKQNPVQQRNRQYVPPNSQQNSYQSPWIKQNRHQYSPSFGRRQERFQPFIEERGYKRGGVKYEKQLVDIFTKALNGNQFEELRLALGLCIVN